MRRIDWLVVTGLISWLAGCGGDEDKACDPVGNTGCSGGEVCEVVTGGAEPASACFAPLLVRGEVRDLSDGTPISGARVVALDVNGAPRSSVAITAAGKFELRIPTAHDGDGNPAGGNLTLRVDAQGYATFPAGIRQSLPIDLATAVATGDARVIESAQTQVGLVRLGSGGTGSISGRIELEGAARGALVVAETAATPGAGFSAIADASGDYQIFNLAAGSYTVRVYSMGTGYTPATVALGEAQTAKVDLSLSGVAASRVSGTVNLVSGSPVTSVILVVASTFNTALARGESPPGIRAPTPGTVPNISGAWSIEGVPAGRYAVLAGFENDGAVRDQSGVGNTDLVFIDVVAGQDLSIGQTFKVTPAIELVGPGAVAPEQVTTAPMLSWVRKSSAKDYKVEVFDALGSVVMSRRTNDGAIVSMAYSGPMQSGMYYQVRVTAYDDAQPTPNQITNTEDLRGVFYVP